MVREKQWFRGGGWCERSNGSVEGCSTACCSVCLFWYRSSAAVRQREVRLVCSRWQDGRMACMRGGPNQQSVLRAVALRQKQYPPPLGFNATTRGASASADRPPITLGGFWPHCGQAGSTGWLTTITGRNAGKEAALAGSPQPLFRSRHLQTARPAPTRRRAARRGRWCAPPPAKQMAGGNLRAVKRPSQRRRGPTVCTTSCETYCGWQLKALRRPSR